MSLKDRIKAVAILANAPDFDDSNDETAWLRNQMTISDKDLDIIFSLLAT